MLHSLTLCTSRIHTPTKVVGSQCRVTCGSHQCQIIYNAVPPSPFLLSPPPPSIPSLAPFPPSPPLFPLPLLLPLPLFLLPSPSPPQVGGRCVLRQVRPSAHARTGASSRTLPGPWGQDPGQQLASSKLPPVASDKHCQVFNRVFFTAGAPSPCGRLSKEEA